jgi:hypothetical protein
MALSDKDKRTLIVGGSIAGVLLVGFLLFNLLSGGGGEEAASTTPPRTSSAPAGGGGSNTGSPTLAPSPVLVLPARDPFSIPPGFSSSSSSSGTSSGGSGSGTSTSSSTSSSPGGGGGGSSTTSTAPGGPSGSNASQTVGGHTVTLLDTFSTSGVSRADVDVDGTVYHPSVGDSFGPNKQYRLQSVSGNCATFLYGDESFTLCVPQNK